jgi:hypothetical protein
MPPNLTVDWLKRAQGRIGTDAMFEANADMVRRVVRGMGPDKVSFDPACGARVVMNMAAVHVPSFCKDGYKNTYDLGKTAVPKQGDDVATIPVRAAVDKVLSNVTNVNPDAIYFGAVEINGSGVRFYGDICLVLKTDVVAPDTVVLTSNSYDLVRPPHTQAGDKPNTLALKAVAQSMAGEWASDVSEIALLKVFDLEVGTRRLTTGPISEAVLDDEDYLEVLKVGSFGVGDLQEARLSAADAAAEAQIGARLQLGACPDMAELEWRKHRRAAGKALQDQAIRTRIITTSGRVRT